MTGYAPSPLTFRPQPTGGKTSPPKTTSSPPNSTSPPTSRPHPDRPSRPLNHIVDTGSKPHQIEHYLTKPTVGRVVTETLNGN